MYFVIAILKNTILLYNAPFVCLWVSRTFCKNWFFWIDLVDTVGQHTLGRVRLYSDILYDLLLTTVFWLAVYYYPTKNITSANNEDDVHQVNNDYFSKFLKYSCIAVVCLSGILVPSFICFVYYILFVLIMVKISVFKLSDRTTVWLFRTICFYTCLHVLILFGYQLAIQEWTGIRENLNFTRWAWYHESKYRSSVYYCSSI